MKEMKLRITGRGVEISDEIKEFALKKMNKLEKLLDNIVEMEVIISKEKFNYIAEGNVVSKLGSFNAKEKGKKEKTAVKSLFDVIEKLAKKEKEKLKGRKRKRRETISRPLKEEKTKFTPSESYTLKPISIDEALIYLGESEDPVFVFRSIDTGKVTIIFEKGKDNYGIIEFEK